MPIDLQQALATGLFIGLIYGLVAIGFSLTFGVMRIANFAHGDFVMIGMYMMIFFSGVAGVPFFFAVILAGLVAALIGMLIERVAIEPIIGHSHFMQMLVTLGALLILQQLAAIIFGDDVRGLDIRLSALDLQVGEAFVSGTRVVAGVAALVIVSLVFVLLKRTYFGRAVRAVADNRWSAQLLGVKTRQVNMAAFGIGSACAGLAGALIIPFAYVNPFVGLGFTIKSFIIVMIAGPASIQRTLIVAVSLGLVESVGGIYVPLSVVPAVVYTVLISVLVILMYRAHRTGSLLALGEKDVT